jgi:hypothetical protein
MRKYWPHLTQAEAQKQRDALGMLQNHKCGICGKDESLFKNKLSVDHNHKTGLVRGLLCYRCNKFIVGRHTYESALKLINYLKIELPEVQRNGGL